MTAAKRTLSLALFLSLVPAAGAQPSSLAEEKALRGMHERTLSARGLPTAGPALLHFFRERTLPREQVEQDQSLITKLGDRAFRTRAHADLELARRLPQVRPLLVQALRKPLSLESTRRLEILLANHPEGDETALAQASAFLLSRAKVPGAAQVLLDYLPFAANPRVVQAVREGLPLLALVGGEPNPAVAAALKDPHPLRRSAAAEALLRAGGLKHKTAAAAVLKEEDPHLRWPIVTALVEAGDVEAVPLLIALLPELDREDAHAAEDLLSRLAGDSAPDVYLEPSQPADRVAQAWLDWYQLHGEDLDLAKLSREPPFLGNLLLTQMSPEKGLSGKVSEIGPDREVLWEIGGMRYPVDARIIAKDRVLIAEYLNNRVTERDFKGVILWEYRINLPVNCQRLPNGHTFIASRKQLLIVDRAGKEVFNHIPLGASIATAQRLRDGQILMVDIAGMLRHLGPDGKELNAFKVGQLYSLGCNIEVLPGGRVLVPAYRENRVVEYNLEGKVLWQADFPSPVSVAPLPGGNVLAVGLGKMRVVELDRAGREVWAMDLTSRPWRARKR